MFRRAALPVISSGAAARKSEDEIKDLLDVLFLAIRGHSLSISKENLLDAYCELFLEQVPVDPNSHPPELSLAEVEQIVDETFHERILRKINLL